MKAHIRLPKARLLVACLFLFSLFFIQQSCTKIDTDKPHLNLNDPTEKFFTVPAGTSPQVNRVIENLKEQNKLTGFIKGIVKDEGYAFWDKAMINTKKKSGVVTLTGLAPAATDTFIHIPLVLEGTEYVNSFILAKLNGTMTLQLFRGREYENYGFGDINADTANAEKLALQLMVMTKEIFGHDKYILKDSRLFNTHHGHLPAHAMADRKFKVSFNQSGSSLWFSDDVTTCTYIQEQNCPYSPCTGPGGSCDNCVLCVGGDYSCTTSTVWYFIPDVTEGGGGGSGGGVDPAGPQGCNPTPPLANGLPPCPRGNNTGWELELEIYNPYQANSVELDTSITNNFPCVAKIVDSISTFLNANAIAQIALHQVFNVDKDIRAQLSIDWSLTKDSADGVTRTDPNYTDSFIFSPTVKLNPWMLNHATHEYIASTIIHEIYHAYIDYKINQYIHQQIDSNTFKALFPIYWPTRGNNGTILTPGEKAQHNIMANNLISIMAAATSSVNHNPFISQVMRDSVNRAIAWGGLQTTTAWKNRSDTFDIQAINLISRDTSVIAPFTQTGYPTIYTNDSHNLHLIKGCQ